MVEAAEELFTPLCVYNNTKDDADATVRDEFKEPSWNNPVVRFVNHDRKQLAPRVNNRWTVGGLTEGMVSALTKAGREVPDYLRLLDAEARGQERGAPIETAIFGMA